MSNEFFKASDGSDLFASFAYAEPPAETDLLPDEDDWMRGMEAVSNDNRYDCDLAVIGSGPAGYTAAIRAAKLGMRTILFEKETLGGLYLNAGCIPMKAYLKALSVFHTVRTAGVYGVAACEGATIDLAKVLSYKNNIVSTLTTNMARLMRSSQVRVEAGDAVMKSAHEIICRGRLYTAAKVIFCGGEVEYPQIPGFSHPGVWTTREIFNAFEVPPRLLVFGGGSAGCEIAAAFAAFGSNVMLFETSSRLLPGMDSEVADAVQRILSDAGVKVFTGISVKEITDRRGDPFVITERGGVLCDKALITTGEKPNLSFLGALAGGIRLENGVIAVDEYLETSVPGVFAVGDVTGSGFRAQTAIHMAEVAVANAVQKNKKVNLRAVPEAVYTTPEAASVGMTEDEAREVYGSELLVGHCPLSANMRAALSKETDGFVKVLAGKKHGEIYGVHIVCKGASEMIAEPSALMRMEVTIHEISDDILCAHPTFSEAFREACAKALGKSVYL